MNLNSTQKTRLAIALGAVVALVLGFAVLNKSDSSSNNAKAQARVPGGPNGQMAPPGGQGGPPGGQGGPGQMQEVTGTAATKAKAAAEAKVDGTAQRVMKNPRGSGYIVIVQTTDGGATIAEVSKDFKVTSTQAMGQGGPGGPPQGAPQQGTSSQQ